MDTPRPPLQRVWDAISTYLSLAYEGTVPAQVQRRLKALHSLATDDAFFSSDMIERETWCGGIRFFVRLGNRHYPHMKLAIEVSPDQSGYMFRADTHDQHCCPPEASKDYPVFCELMERNRLLAQAIESAWSQVQIPTFKTYLREDFARRKSAASSGSAAGSKG